MRLRDTVVHFPNATALDVTAAMASAAGLVHYASQARNPAVLYEALSFGLPLLVSVQSMPYLGLQCRNFVKLTDANTRNVRDIHSLELVDRG